MNGSLLKSPWVKFLGIFVISYFVFVGLFNVEPIEAIVNTSYRSISQSFLTLMLPDAKIVAELGTQDGKRDVNVMAVNFSWTQSLVDKMIERAKQQNITNISVPHRFVNYYLYQFFTVPFIFLLSLLIATPQTAKNKIISIFLGMVILGAYLLTKLFMFVIFSISNVKIGIYELSHDYMLILQKMANVLTLGVSIILSLIIWGVISFRRSKLKEELLGIFNVIQNKTE